MSSKCHLLDLPDEVLLPIAIKLSLADLFSCLLSCRRLSLLIAESSLIQYLIRTMRHGLYDPLISDISIPQRVKALEIWESAWLDLGVGEPSQRYLLSDIGLRPDDAGMCAVQSGILIGARFNDLHPSGGYCYLDFLHLLNESKAVACINIPNIGGDAHVQSWTYAPESDLIAIILRSGPPAHQYRMITNTDSRHRTDTRSNPPNLKLHQFSTGDKHPSAANYSPQFNQISSTRAACLECCGDSIVVVMLDGERMKDENRDYIFLLRGAQTGTYCTLVTFLSHDILVFARRDIFALEVCKLDRAGGDAAPTLQTVCLLKLPNLLSGQQIVDIRVSQASPLSGNHPSYTQGSSIFPFRSNPEDDILAFDVCKDHSRRIIFVARRRTLLSLASKSGTSMPHSPAVKAWEDWGPRATHWMELDPLNDSISLSGSRCVLVKYSHLRNHFVLDLRDFNPYRVRARSARNKAATSTATTSSQAILSAEACFEEDIVSELPFVSIRKENVGSRVLLDDEWMAEILWDEDAHMQSIQFRTIWSPAEPSAS
ncbi:hypothetical protein BJV78DRAFT_1282409 [Lactifluus subvellereus]|nr:hypothetical protein BJV78DRAFT_1282409 [Lactifluus subvellereus]